MVSLGITWEQKISGTPKAEAIGMTSQAGTESKPRHLPKADTATSPPKSSEDIRAVIERKLQRIADAMADYVESTQRDLRIKVDNETDHIVIQVISRSSGKVIRQVPPEELLRLAAKMEEMVGVFFNTNA